MDRQRWLITIALTTAMGGVGMTACGDDDESGTQTFELEGEWTSLFGDETITDTEWNGNALIEFDEDMNFAVTQTPTSAQFNPGKFNKIVYTEPEVNSFFYCFVDFGVDTAAMARTSTQTADASDPSVGGCGAFPWTQLTRK